MAVTIDVVEVEVSEARPETSPSQSAAAPQQQRIDLASAPRARAPRAAEGGLTWAIRQ
jgi:hypothetical protein